MDRSFWYKVLKGEVEGWGKAAYVVMERRKLMSERGISD